ncbi:CHAP domain-containing protein [Gordonia sp. NB41Y]|uniref:CHAP domain-containing protein n=1 Tax=Gordonia sp. NB41Y TaxID=875808 RepID=UPI0006B1C137|nr:CHAP domain-containing protein [Gordonia sp. NB41Y]EMP13708.2 membrane protein [Gordonia sp. NB41Y]WLP93252.1 CHAP domain-containing protein [Gordonia sp. NB41Y]
MARSTRRRRQVWAVVAVALIVAVGVGVLAVRAAPDRWLPWDTAEIPVDTVGLTPTQVRIVELLRSEHAAQRPGTFYSEGVDEPWCADFVSWVLREAGQPLSNPNSGHWRIPGVYTLQEYYEDSGRFEPVGRYTPRVGDVVLYDRSSGFGQHTNVVVAVDGGTATTVGGNEMGRIRVHRLDWASDAGVVGFGRSVIGDDGTHP